MLSGMEGRGGVRASLAMFTVLGWACREIKGWREVNWTSLANVFSSCLSNLVLYRIGMEAMIVPSHYHDPSSVRGHCIGLLGQ